MAANTFVVVHDFVAESANELSVRVNDTVTSTGSVEDGWLMCSVLNNPMQTGFVPFGYLKPSGQQPPQFQQQPPQLQQQPPQFQQQQFQQPPQFQQQGSFHQQQPPQFQQQGSFHQQQPPQFQQQGSFHQQPPQFQQQGSFHQQQQPTPIPQQGSFQQQQQPLPQTNSQSFAQQAAADAKKRRESKNNPFADLDALNALENKQPPADQFGAMSLLPESEYAQVAGANGGQPVDHNASFQATLKLWKDRERRFLAGEKERLPKPKTREYFFWDRQGNRHGPLTEAEMRKRFDNRQLAVDTPIQLSTVKDSIPAKRIEEYFPEIQAAFVTAPVAPISTQMWCYVDDSNQVQGPFSSEQMYEWFQDGFFAAETVVRLANQTNMEFKQLGSLFPEGAGAFLSPGNQQSPCVPYNALAPGRGAIPAQPPAADNNMVFAPIPAAAGAWGASAPAPAAPQQQGLPPPALGAPQQQQNLWDTPAPAAQTAAWGTTAATGTDPMNPFGAPAPTAMGSGADFGQPIKPIEKHDLLEFDPFLQSASAGEGGDVRRSQSGKQLLKHALSTGEPAVAAGVAAGAAAGAAAAAEPPGVPPALQANPDEWDIEYDEKRPHTPRQREMSSAELADNPVMPHNDPSEAGSPSKVAPYDMLVEKYLHSVESMYQFLTRPLPKELGTVRCRIRREITGVHINYNLFEVALETDNKKSGKIIMEATRHHKYGVDPYYWLSFGRDAPKGRGTVLGHLVYSGGNYVLHNDVKNHKGKPKDNCAVAYTKSSGYGPREIKACIPGFKDNGRDLIEFRSGGSTKKSALLKNLNSYNFTKLQPFVNKKPVWSAKHHAYTLNFHGRVTKASVKNFQLVPLEGDSKDVVLLHGRVSQNLFTMDVTYPMSLISAFAICISSQTFSH